jgi:hypothetical protein
MANATPADARAGFEIFRAANGEIQLAESNRHTSERPIRRSVVRRSLAWV